MAAKYASRYELDVNLAKLSDSKKDLKTRADRFEAYLFALHNSNGCRALLEFLVPLVRQEYFAPLRYNEVPTINVPLQISSCALSIPYLRVLSRLQLPSPFPLLFFLFKLLTFPASPKPLQLILSFRFPPPQPSSSRRASPAHFFQLQERLRCLRILPTSLPSRTTRRSLPF
jgi:hypothetical protein